MTSSGTTANIVDWVVVGLSGVLFIACSAGGVYVATYGGSTSRHAGAGFNYLWQSRLCFQLAGAAYALGQLLRLQVLWGPRSVFGSAGGHASAMCRAYIAVEYGLLEPASLLLALFTCFYSIKSKLAPPVTGGLVWSIAQPPVGSPPEPNAALTPKPGIAHPNFNIVFFALGFTLPCSTAQLLCALFSRIFGEYDGVAIFRLMFSAYDERETDHCPADVDPSHCAWCVFPLLSTLISAAFLLSFLLALLVVTSRIAAAAISKLLIQRVRMLQVVVSISLMGSVACRGVTVLFQPFDLGFELLRLGHVVLFTVALLALSYLLIWRPVRDARLAEKHVKQLQIMTLDSPFAFQTLQSRPSSSNGGGGGGGAVGAVSVVSAVGGATGGGTFWQNNAGAIASDAVSPRSVDTSDVRLGIGVGSTGTPPPPPRGSLQVSSSAAVTNSSAAAGMDAAVSGQKSGSTRTSAHHHQHTGSSSEYGGNSSSRIEPERQPLVADQR